MQTALSSSVRRANWAWLGTVPFFLFALAFMFLPAWTILSGSFRDPAGSLTLNNLRDLFQERILTAYSVSIQISVITALIGAAVGTLLAYAITWGGLPRSVRSAVITFSSVASNAGGILAFAFITLLGRTGALPKFLKTLGIDLYANGFSIYSVAGLVLTYIYFQFPLMVLIMTPA